MCWIIFNEQTIIAHGSKWADYNEFATLYAINLKILNLQLIKSLTKKEFDWNYDPDIASLSNCNWTKLIELKNYTSKTGSSSANTIRQRWWYLILRFTNWIKQNDQLSFDALIVFIDNPIIPLATRVAINNDF